jgi:hypothetical protein
MEEKRKKKNKNQSRSLLTSLHSIKPLTTKLYRNQAQFRLAQALAQALILVKPLTWGFNLHVFILPVKFYCI